MRIVDSAMYYLNQSIKKSIEIKNYSRLFYNYYSLGIHESRSNNNTLATEYFLKALENANKVDNKGNIAYANSMLGVIYEEQEFYDKAEKKYKKSLEVFKNLGHIYGIAGQYGNLAGLYASKDANYTKSNTMYRKSLEYYKEVNAQESICIVQYNLGRNYLNEKKLDSARYFLYKSYNLGRKIDSDYALTGVLLIV